MQALMHAVRHGGPLPLHVDGRYPPARQQTGMHKVHISLTDPWHIIAPSTNATPPRSGHPNCRNVPERFAGTL